MVPANRGLTVLFYIIIIYYIYALLTKHEVNMAGYWPSFFFAFLWTETKSRSIKTQKSTRPISSHLDRTSLVNKGFIKWPKDYAKRLSLLQDQCGQSQAGKMGSQSEHRIHFILPAHGTSHIINYVISIHTVTAIVNSTS